MSTTGADLAGMQANNRQPLRWYTIVCLLATLLPVLAVAVYNAHIDPLWIMPSAVRKDVAHCVRDERQNKINMMIYGRPPGSSVLIGSSRAAFLDPSTFEPNLFNYSVNGIRPIEFAPYLKNYQREHAAPRTLYVGLDEFGIMAAAKDELWLKRAEENYTSARAVDYRLNQLLNAQVLQYSWETVTTCQSPDRPPVPRYTPTGLRDQVRLDQAVATQRRGEHAAWFQNFYRTAKLDPDYRKHLEALRDTLPETKIIPFLTPVRRELIEHWALAGRLPDMRQWLHDVVSTFGATYNFMVPSTFAASEDFFDGHHFYRSASSVLADVLTERKPADLDNIGSRVDLATLDTHIDAVRAHLCRTIAPARKAPSKLDCTGVDGPADPDATVRNRAVPYAMTPSPANWEAGTANSKFTVESDRLLIDSQTKLYEYIWSTTAAIPMRYDTTYTLAYDLTGTAGSVSIGILANGLFRKVEPEATGKGQFTFDVAADTAHIIMFNNGKSPTNIVIKSIELRW